MAFNPEQFQAIIDKLNAGLETISKFVTDIGPKVESAVNHWFIPDGVAQACVWIINKVIKAVNWVIAKLVDIMMGAYAPAIVFYNSVTWQGEEIRGKASGVASSTQKFNLTAPKYWEGEGATAYTNAVFPQSAASAQVASSSRHRLGLPRRLWGRGMCLLRCRSDLCGSADPGPCCFNCRSYYCGRYSRCWGCCRGGSHSRARGHRGCRRRAAVHHRCRGHDVFRTHG